MNDKDTSETLSMAFEDEIPHLHFGIGFNHSMEIHIVLYGEQAFLQFLHQFSIKSRDAIPPYIRR